MQVGSTDRDGNTCKTRLFIVRDHIGMKRMLKDSPWETADYCRVLSRLPGAKRSEQSIHITGLGNKRGVYVELEP
jgi:hypothetical protein